MTLVSKHINTGFKVGILGGGQLGKMFCQAASPWDLQTYILDEDPCFPAGATCSQFITGSFKSFEDVYNFGKMVDVLTVEIEHVNTDALLQLEKEGLEIHPSPSQLNIIKDKGLQKQFYADHQIPSPAFRLFDGPESVKKAVESGILSLPFVQKTRTAGYDGRGVLLVKNRSDLDQLLQGPCLTEDLVDLEKEIAVIVARNPSGEVKCFPAVAMEVHPEANLVDFLTCPAGISSTMEAKAADLAIRTIEAFNLCGLLAVEMFIAKDGSLWVNEVAPRPHNSGHHTIESCFTSQFQQHLRAILNLPLGSTEMKMPSVMLNLLGEPGFSGPARYDGFEACLSMKGCFIHLYGKTITKPFRKMGHATVLDQSLEKAKEKASRIKDLLRIISA